MENNDNLDESQDTSSEDVKDEEQTSEENTKDWKAEALKYKAIAERSEKKLQQPPQEEEANKSNSTTGLTREEAIFFAQGGTEEQLEVAKGISMGKKVTLAEALKDPAYKAIVNQQSREAEVKKNQLPASGGSAANVQAEKSPGEMTEAEHKAWAKQVAIKKVNA